SPGVSFAPRIASVPAVALAATLLLGLLGAAPARPAPTATAAPVAPAAPLAPAARAPPDAPPLTHGGAQLLRQQLSSVPPPRPARVAGPATATSALIGASLAGLAWLRRRRRGQTATEEAPDPAPPSADAA